MLEHIFAPLCRALSLGGLLDEETLAAVRDRRRRQQAQRRERLRRGGVAGPPLPPLAPVHIRPEPPQPQQEGRSHGADDEREGEEEEEEEGKQGGGPLAAVVGALRLVALLVLSGAGAVLAASVAAQLPVRLGRWLLRRWLGALWGAPGPLAAARSEQHARAHARICTTNETQF